MIARGLHLYPFRTEKLNLAAPMILRKWESRSPPPYRKQSRRTLRPAAFLFYRSAPSHKSVWPHPRASGSATKELPHIPTALPNSAEAPASVPAPQFNQLATISQSIRRHNVGNARMCVRLPANELCGAICVRHRSSCHRDFRGSHSRGIKSTRSYKNQTRGRRPDVSSLR